MTVCDSVCVRERDAFVSLSSLLSDCLISDSLVVGAIPPLTTSLF